MLAGVFMTAGVPLAAATSTLIVALTTYGVATTLKSLRRCVLRNGSQMVCLRFSGRGGGGEDVLGIMHGRMTIDPRTPTILGRSTSGFHRPDRLCTKREAP